MCDVNQYPTVSKAIESQPRVHLYYQNEEVRTQARRKTRELLKAAQDQEGTDGSSLCTATILARKALQYRRMLERANSANLDDPCFDVDEFLGIRWCKTQV